VPFRLCLALALSALLIAAAPALADDYCVPAPSPGCTMSFPDIQAALNQAQTHSGPDRVLIASGDFAVATGGFTYSDNDPVEIRGAGQRATVLRQANPTPAGQETALRVTQVGSTGRSLVAELGLVVGDQTTGLGGANEALAIGKGVDATDIRVTASGAARPRGVNLGGDATLRRADIDLGYSTVGSEGKIAVTTAVSTDVANVEDSSLRADTGGWAINGSTLNVRRTRVTGSREGLAATTGNIVAENVVVRLDPQAGGGGVALGATASGGPASIDVRHATVTGGNQFSTGLAVNAVDATASGSLNDSIVRTPGHALWRICNPGQTSTLTADYNAFLPGATFDDTLAGSGSLNNTNRRTDGPGFVDEGAGDLRVGFGSPMVDSGNPAGPASPTTDLNGDPRVVDGNGDGTARRDLGAFEYQRRPPVATAAVTPASALEQSPFSWTATASDPDGDPLTFGWAWDDGATAGGASASHWFISAGRHTGTVTATDPAGLTATATAAVDVTPLQGDPGPRDVLAPVFSIVSRKLRLTAKNTVTVRMSCGAVEPEQCLGTLTLASAKKLGRKRRVLKLGSAEFGINPGRPKNIKIKVSRSAAATVRRLGKLNVTVSGEARDAAGNQLTVRRTATLVSARTRR
jgi:hypothetical protein